MSPLWGRLAQISHTQSTGTRGVIEAWLLPSLTFPEQSITDPNHSGTHREEGVGETV